MHLFYATQYKVVHWRKLLYLASLTYSIDIYAIKLFGKITRF